MKDEKKIYETPEIEIVELPQDLLKSGDPTDTDWDDLTL